MPLGSMAGGGRDTVRNTNVLKQENTFHEKRIYSHQFFIFWNCKLLFARQFRYVCVYIYMRVDRVLWNTLHQFRVAFSAQKQWKMYKQTWALGPPVLETKTVIFWGEKANNWSALLSTRKYSSMRVWFEGYRLDMTRLYYRKRRGVDPVLPPARCALQYGLSFSLARDPLIDTRLLPLLVLDATQLKIWCHVTSTVGKDS